MLDGKRYFTAFPALGPYGNPALLPRPRLLYSLRALEQELRAYCARSLDTGIAAGASNP